MRRAGRRHLVLGRPRAAPRHPSDDRCRRLSPAGACDGASALRNARPAAGAGFQRPLPCRRSGWPSLRGLSTGMAPRDGAVRVARRSDARRSNDCGDADRRAGRPRASARQSRGRRGERGARDARVARSCPPVLRSRHRDGGSAIARARRIACGDLDGVCPRLDARPRG